MSLVGPTAWVLSSDEVCSMFRNSCRWFTPVDIFNRRIVRDPGRFPFPLAILLRRWIRSAENLCWCEQGRVTGGDRVGPIFC